MTPAPVADTPREGGVAQRSVALILGGVGLGALAAGGVLGVAALVKKGDLDAACGGSASTCTAPQGSLDGQRAEQRDYARLSTVGLVVGGLAVVAGFVLHLTAPRSRTHVSVTAGAGPSGASLQLGGRF